MDDDGGIDEMNGGANVVGFQLPLGADDERRRRVEALVGVAPIDEMTKVRLRSMLPEHIDRIHAMIELGELRAAVSEAETIAGELALRELVRSRVREVVRRKGGGGGYTLYSPNKGKKKAAKSVGEFPTKLAAKRAELQRFPPKDINRLKRLRKEVDRLQKDPKKAAEKERQWAHPRKKHEGLELVREAVRQGMFEALFREEEQASQWDERVSKLSKAAVTADKRLQTLQKAIEKRTEAAISSAFGQIAKALKRKKLRAEADGVKKDVGRQKTFMQFTVSGKGVEVGPFYVFAEAGKLKLEVSDEARASFSKLDPEQAKAIRAELVTVQEDVLSSDDSIVSAIAARDKYLGGVETEVDEMLADLGPLHITMLKGLLNKKYRGGNAR